MLNLRYDVQVASGYLVDAYARKNTCTCCDPKSVANNPSVLERWRREGRADARKFLEAQFGKRLEDLDTSDLLVARRRCTEFLSPRKAKALARPRNKPDFIAQLSAPETHEGLQKLSAADSAAFIRTKYGVDVQHLSKKQMTTLRADVMLLRLLDTAFVAKYILAPARPNMLDMIRALPGTASLAEVNRVLMGLPLRGRKPVFNAVTGLVELEDLTWRNIRLGLDVSTLPVTMRDAYATRLGLAPRKPVKEVREKPRALPRAVVAPAKPVVTPLKAEKPQKGKRDPNTWDALPAMSDDELDALVGLKKPVPKPVFKPVSEPTGVMVGDEIVRFINFKANQGLLPGDIPRGSMAPPSTWSNTDWAIVHRYRQHIDPTWYHNYQPKIDAALRAFTHITGETTASINLGSVFGELLLDLNREYERIA